MLLAYITRIHLLLALGYLFTTCSGEARKVIGYRTVDAEEATKINQKHRLFRDPAFDGDGSVAEENQIGNGFYLVPKPAGLRSTPDKKQWYCVIKAEEERLDEVSKVWIPQTYNSRSFWGDRDSGVLWGGGEKTIARYVEGFKVDPDKTLRFTYIQGREPQLQMLIPTKMANDDLLDFFAECFETVVELPANGKKSVDFRQWDVKGDPGV
ncbi:hypothetical protein LZ30DRAFT_430108 [Colletotrichum cereale]|nr:hypothetical protein LZ30DRAFT_430108 [Colletotrichum cereale]